MADPVQDQKVEKALEALKAEGKAVLQETVVELAHKVNSRLLPKAIDVATAKIPGTVDDAFAEMLKPLLEQTLKELIGSIKL